MKKVVNFKIEKEEWKELQDKAFKKLNKTAKIDGFRPGKAPRSVFEKKYGKEELLLEAGDIFINDKYRELMSKNEVKPILEPKVDVVTTTEDAFEFNLVIIEAPEVKLNNYKDLKVKKERVKVSQEEITSKIDHILDHYAEVVEKDGKVENGDIAIIDFEGFKDGVAFEGGKGENYSLEIGSHSFIEGFEEGLIGLAKDETKELNLTFPKDYFSEDLKGQKVTFKVKINDIKTRVIPELNDEFFEDLAMDDVNSKEELEEVVKNQLLAEKEQEAENKYIDDLLEAAAKNMEVDIDEEIVQIEVDAMYEDFLNKLAMQGLNEEIYFKYANTTKEDTKKDIYPEAEKKLKYHYLLNEIVKLEKLNVTEEEVASEYVKLASRYNATIEELRNEINAQELRHELLMMKAIDVLKNDESKN